MDTVRIVPKISGDDLRISATSFMAFQQCPAQADARFRQLYGPQSKSSFVGSLAHHVFRRHLESGRIDSSEFVRACREEIGNSSRLNNVMAELKLKPSSLEGVIEEVRDLYERFASLTQEGFVDAEIFFELAVADGVELIGQVDAVFEEELGGFRLVDWKTGELGTAEAQLLFYALLWTLDKGELPSRLEAISVKTGERFSSTPSTTDVVKIAGDVGRMVDELRTTWSSGDDFARHGGPWCRYCPLLEDCPEGGATIKILNLE